jgi:hypothetical protein
MVVLNDINLPISSHFLLEQEALRILQHYSWLAGVAGHLACEAEAIDKPGV